MRSNFVMIFNDMTSREKPVLFVTPGHGQSMLQAFAAFPRSHHRQSEQIVEAACDMSDTFLSAALKTLPHAQIAAELVPYHADRYPGAERGAKVRAANPSVTYAPALGAIGGHAAGGALADHPVHQLHL